LKLRYEAFTHEHAGREALVADFSNWPVRDAQFAAFRAGKHMSPLERWPKNTADSIVESIAILGQRA
jgi:hypothetical protein